MFRTFVPINGPASSGSLDPGLWKRVVGQAVTGTWCRGILRVAQGFQENVMVRNTRCAHGPSGLILIAALAGFTACVGDVAPGDADSTEGNAAIDLAVCDLLTDEEVTGILPGHDGGIVTSGGGSLIEGVDTFRCSYTSPGEGIADFDLLTVSVTVAANAGLFEQVRPVAADRRGSYDNVTEIDAGDGGLAYGDSSDMMVDVWQGTTVVTLELVRDDAAGHTDRLIELATTVLANVN